LKELLPMFEEARVCAEPVFKHTEEFLTTTAESLAQKNGWETRYVLSLQQGEMERVLKDGVLLDRKKVEERYSCTAILSYKDGQSFLVGEEAESMEKNMVKGITEGILKGATAYGGKVTGTVRIVLDPSKAEHFQEGDILVTGMTRPEYLSLIKKSVAFVTDAGGVLSHAAIVARELRKPCVIGTQRATKILKDGDLVEVDANQGVVTILKRLS